MVIRNDGQGILRITVADNLLARRCRQAQPAEFVLTAR